MGWPWQKAPVPIVPEASALELAAPMILSILTFWILPGIFYIMTVSDGAKATQSGGGNASSEPSIGRRIVKGLFTKEDYFNFHKMIGISVLVHFFYRFSNVGPVKDMLFGPTPRTLASIALHALLSASSLIFRIPTKRIAEGSRIWPEYRLHSISFAYRSLACMLVVWAEAKLDVTEPVYAANAAIVIATMGLADLGSWYVGPAGRSSTIQELDAPPFMRFFFSVMQFHATAGCLIGVRRFATQFMYVWIIRTHTHPQP